MKKLYRLIIYILIPVMFVLSISCNQAIAGGNVLVINVENN